MKKIAYLMLAALCFPLVMTAQSYDDDLYYIPKKETNKKEEKAVAVPVVEKSTTVYTAPGSTVVIQDRKGNVRDVDAYNRRYDAKENEFVMEDDTLYIKEKPVRDLDGEWVDEFEGSQDDYEYAQRIIRFRNPRYAIPISSPYYWDVVYGLNSWDWNVYTDGLYAYAFPTFTNRLWWDWRYGSAGMGWGPGWGYGYGWNSWYAGNYWGWGGYWPGYWYGGWGWGHHHNGYYDGWYSGGGSHWTGTHYNHRRPNSSYRPNMSGVGGARRPASSVSGTTGTRRPASSTAIGTTSRNPGVSNGSRTTTRRVVGTRNQTNARPSLRQTGVGTSSSERNSMYTRPGTTTGSSRRPGSSAGYSTSSPSSRSSSYGTGSSRRSSSSTSRSYTPSTNSRSRSSSYSSGSSSRSSSYSSGSSSSRSSGGSYSGGGSSRSSGGGGSSRGGRR